MAINRVCIAGNLTRDAELRVVGDPQQGGFYVLNFAVAVNERHKDKSTGEWVNNPLYMDCSLFGPRAEAIAQWMTVGRKVMVAGKLHRRVYQKDDEQRTLISIWVDDIELTREPRRDGAEAAAKPSAPQRPQAAPSYAPTGYGLYDEDVLF